LLTLREMVIGCRCHHLGADPSPGLDASDGRSRTTESVNRKHPGQIMPDCRYKRQVTARRPGCRFPRRQLREEFPWDEAPRYLLHDRDHAFDRLGATAKAMGIEEVLTAPRATWAKCLRWAIHWIRSSCGFDHVIVFNEAGLHRLMTRYCS